jgi:hypothetical protein
VTLDRSVLPATIDWSDLPGPYNVYRGTVDTSGSWGYSHTCLVSGVGGPPVAVGEDPPPGTLYYFLLSRVLQCRESVIGRDGSGAPIPNASPCGGGSP